MTEPDTGVSSDGRIRVDDPPRLPGDNRSAAYEYDNLHDRLLEALWREHLARRYDLPAELLRKFDVSRFLREHA